MAGAEATLENGKVNFTPKDFATDQDVRWCPGCGGLLNSQTGPNCNGRDRPYKRTNRIHIRNRLCGQISILYGDIWDAQHPWKGTGFCQWFEISET